MSPAHPPEVLRLYESLGVKPGASLAEIRHAYKMGAVKRHRDKTHIANDEKFQAFLGDYVALTKYLEERAAVRRPTYPQTVGAEANVRK